MVPVGPKTLQPLGTVDKYTQVQFAPLVRDKRSHVHARDQPSVHVLFQGITTENGRRPTASRAWVTSVR